MGVQNLVLFSGGWDSVFCAIVAKRTELTPPLLCFFNYAQSYQEQEARAVADIAVVLGCNLVTHSIEPVPSKGGGIFDNRNEVLLAHAVGEHAPSRVYFGSRNLIPALDKYGDSNWVWARRMSRKHKVLVKTPATMLPKAYIRWYVQRAGVPSGLVFSTEGLKP